MPTSPNSFRFGDVGTWELNLATDALIWSSQTYAIFGLPEVGAPLGFVDFLGHVHPDDRGELQARQREAIKGRTKFDYIHRIVRPSGEMRFVREVAELLSGPGIQIFHGVVQDITELLANAVKAEQSAKLLTLAGRKARLGGWRYILGEQHVHWSDETAAIHKMPAGTLPTVDEAIAFYAPDSRDKIRSAFEKCVADGKSFDEVLSIVTPSGRTLAVRAIGEAEFDGGRKVLSVFGAFQDVSDLVEVREQSRQLSVLLAETLDNISDGFVTLNKELQISYINAGAITLLGGAALNPLGQTLEKAFPKSQGLELHDHLRGTLNEPGYSAFTCYMPARHIWLDIRLYPSSEGTTVYFHDSTKEVDQRKSLHLLESAISSLGDIIIITEASPIDPPDGPKIVYVNDAFTRHTGYSRDEAIGRSPRFLQGAGTERKKLDDVRHALQLHEGVKTEILNYRKGGEPFWIEMEIVPIAPERKEIKEIKEISHFVAIERDISERKRVEEILRIREERFRLVAGAENDGVWDWNVLADNISFSQPQPLFSYTSLAAHSLAGWLDFVHAEDRDDAAAAMQAALSSGAADWTIEYRFLTLDGAYAIALHRGSILRNSAGAATRVVGSLTDITNRRRLEERIRQSEKLEAVGQMTGGVAHDFNNLLTVILGNAESLKLAMPENDKLRPLVEMMMLAAERGAELTNRLLAFSRRQPLQPKLADANALLRGMAALLRRAIPAQIELVLNLADGVCTTLIDPAQLEVAVLNLVLNAKYAMAGEGRIIIETKNVEITDEFWGGATDIAPGSYILLAITDDGAGMPPEVAERAFDPFFTTKPVGEGSGLGLSMVYGFVKQCGGYATIYSELGKGTSVKLYLPCSDGSAEIAHDDALPEAEKGCEHILVVEDDALVRQHATTTLSGLGYRISEAASAKDALKLLDSTPGIDLLFTDMVMPGGINGRELADRARALHPTLKVIFTSGYTEEAIVGRSWLDTGVSFLGKPYKRNELARIVREVLGKD